MQHNHRSHLLRRRAGPDTRSLQLRNASPNPKAEPQADSGIATVISVVYVTASPTFTGPIASYSTQSVDVGAPLQSNSISSSALASSDTASNTGSVTETDSATTTNALQPSSIQSRPPKSLTSIQTATTLSAVASSSSAVTASSFLSVTGAAIATSANAATAPGATSIPVTSSGNGLSGGGKAGLALGILIAIAVILCLILLFYRRRRKRVTESHRRIGDEKSTASNHDGPHLSASSPVAVALGTQSEFPSARSNRSAPRLSLRPLTTFDPNLSGDRRSADPSSMIQLASGLGNIPSSSAGKGNATQPNADDPANPFGDHAQGSPTSTSATSLSPLSPLDNDPKELDASTISLAVTVPEAHTESVTHPAASVISSSAVIVTSPSSSPAPASPAPASPASMTSINSSPASAATKSNNIHRVQLDFKPSMDDEILLTAGQLVRLTHEYDDGWALCVRLDRSQQGVAPRTCLSKHPIKPRPANPAQVHAHGPLPVARSAPQARPAGPAPRSQPLKLESPFLRTIEFNGQRPTPLGDRSGSNSSLQGVPNRKPVAGQAPLR